MKIIVKRTFHFKADFTFKIYPIFSYGFNQEKRSHYLAPSRSFFIASCISFRP